jgi:hypothetical protein
MVQYLISTLFSSVRLPEVIGTDVNIFLVPWFNRSAGWSIQPIVKFLEVKIHVIDPTSVPPASEWTMY